ncbi:DUF4344 domain-containing metallopeptidase [Nocardia lijiangensis]|uniref:DUF4344 domain-containing metallopeptidase n=1 Tax=Nocardia lijiangensis TaxID=299618 RepID=UPI0013902EDC|nr:DUF4344 domain-containing metallopeptidase [Nocardia lijiangensis]
MVPKWCRWAGAAAMVIVATAACGADDGEKPASQATGTATTGQAPDTGKFVPRYDRAIFSEEAKAGKSVAQDNKILEDLAQDMGAMYRLPKDIPVVGMECGAFNAFWDPDSQSIVLCYEMFAVAEEYAKAQSEGRPDYFNVYFDGVTRMIAFHESAHMAISLFSLPTTGREEDSADQLAALLQLTDPGPSGAGGVAAAADFWFDISDDPAAFDADTFADEHSLSQVRGYNLLCWVYGALPDVLSVLVTMPGEPEQEGRLPYERAEGCVDEYKQMRAAWATLLKPYIEVELGVSDDMGTTTMGAQPTTTIPTR